MLNQPGVSIASARNGCARGDGADFVDEPGGELFAVSDACRGHRLKGDCVGYNGRRRARSVPCSPCFIVVGRADQPPMTVDGSTDDACCCASIVDGDIITEAPADSTDACAAREQGSCVDQATIDARLTPHPCCPDATGERCCE